MNLLLKPFWKLFKPIPDKQEDERNALKSALGYSTCKNQGNIMSILGRIIGYKSFFRLKQKISASVGH